MKYLVAFALLAAATALPEPARLLAPSPVDIAPLVVPQEVMDAVALTVKVVDAPEPSAEDPSAYAVNFVEEASNVDAAPLKDASAYAVNFVEEASIVDANEDVSAYAVKFVEEAVNAEAPAVETAEISGSAVNVVNEVADALAVDANEDVSAFAVNFVDEAVNAEIPAPISFQIPLPESVVLPLNSIVLPSVDTVLVADAPVESINVVSPVKVVDVADVDEETPSYVPIKQYPDPRWR